MNLSKDYDAGRVLLYRKTVMQVKSCIYWKIMMQAQPCFPERNVIVYDEKKKRLSGISSYCCTEIPHFLPEFLPEKRGGKHRDKPYHRGRA